MNDKVFLKTVGEKIQAIRKERGISIRKLGELCKMDYSNLSRLESGQKNGQIITLKRIAEVLGNDIKDFL